MTSQVANRAPNKILYIPNYPSKYPIENSTNTLHNIFTIQIHTKIQKIQSITISSQYLILRGT